MDYMELKEKLAGPDPHTVCRTPHMVSRVEGVGAIWSTQLQILRPRASHDG